MNEKLKEALELGISYTVELIDRCRETITNRPWGEDGIQSDLAKMREALTNDGWQGGHPSEAMWCLVTALSKDPEPVRFTAYLWFNPMATHHWWEGRAGNCERFICEVLAYQPLPAPFTP